ncbi:MAG: hypothetical protein ACI8RZ_004489 [Myxococcota bacterium]|jgi:hypothetical protein
MKIRRARLSDVSGMLALKSALTFTESMGTSTRGGFLLGTDAAGYRMRIQHGLAWVLDDGAIKGFAIILPDGPFRQSAVWQSRDAVRWSIDPQALVDSTLGYYDQLAVTRRGGRRYASALALTALVDLMDQGADHLVTATVSAPVVNLAAVPYLKRLGGVCVGRLDEHYPAFGALVSDIWVVSRQGYEAWIAEASTLSEQWVRDLALSAVRQ